MKVQQEPEFDHRQQRFKKKKKINFVGTFSLLSDLDLCALFKLNKTSVVPSTEDGN